ncbi:MAG: hypothetical protein SF172_16225 [Burkholderiales bacterium]|nr:hypothetical protein [Burkholderiales bacterium]
MLHLAGVGKLVWISHLVAIGLAGVLAWLVGRFGRQLNRHGAALVIVALSVVGLMIPLLNDRPGPDRWASIGPLNLYLAPMLLPSFVAACSFFVRQPERQWIAALIAILVVALLLVLQPDASQMLGLLVASGVLAIRYRLGAARSFLLLLPLAVLAAWAFSVPDPLQPVPHVEEVFKLALSHSYFAGIAVIASALAFIVGLWIQSRVGPAWLSAVAAYYAVLFACSSAGLTPAPLVGYGAGPILGFGLMVGLLAWFEPPSQGAA